MAGRPSAVRRPSIARISSARSGRPCRSSRRPAQRASSTWANRGSGTRSWPYELTFCPEERDFLVPASRERPRFVDDLVERTAPFRPAAERHDAVGAGLVTAVDDRQPRTGPRGPGDGPLPHGPRTGRGEAISDADDGPTHHRGRSDAPDRRLRGGQAEPVDQLGFLVRPQEQVHGRIAPAQAIAVRFADRTAGQHDAQRRVRGLELAQLALPTDDLLLGALPDRAGVDDDELGVVKAGRLIAAGPQQATGHLLRVAPVHLAAERPEVEARQGAGLREVLGQSLVGRHRRMAWRGGRTGHEAVQHGQGAGGGDPVGHSARHRTPVSSADSRSRSGWRRSRRVTPASGGTHRSACASAYVPRSP